MLSLTRLVLCMFLLAHLAVANRQIQTLNKCPSSTEVFVNGNSQGSLSANGGTAFTSVSNNFTGFIYTNANGGAQSGAGTTRAGFFGQDAYYYLVTDPKGFNVEISITPFKGSANNFCVPATCSALGCPTAYTFPPTGFSAPTSKAPQPPLYECPQSPNNVGFTVTFCPSGKFPPPPPPASIQIHPNGNSGKCMDVRGAVYADGTPVQIYDCNGTGAQNWIVNKGNTKVQVAGTNFCLDAGSSPGNGVGLKIWTCYSGLAAQAWYYTDDNRIALTGQGLCLDLTNGVLSNGNRLQTWQCTNGNTNQVWTV